MTIINLDRIDFHFMNGLSDRHIDDFYYVVQTLHYWTQRHGSFPIEKEDDYSIQLCYEGPKTHRIQARDKEGNYIHVRIEHGGGEPGTTDYDKIHSYEFALNRSPVVDKKDYTNLYTQAKLLISRIRREVHPQATN